jgi:hypothetical protein
MLAMASTSSRSFSSEWLKLERMCSCMIQNELR